MHRNMLRLTTAGATIEQDEEGRPFVKVALTLGIQEIELVIHQSLTHTDCLNVEIDGNFAEELALRLHVNDGIVFDSHGERWTPPLKDRAPDLAPNESLDDVVSRLMAATTSTTSELIDDQVRDDAAELGANVNNGGIETQVRFLLEQGHSEDTIADWLG